jgi:proteasome lid subunit RPN8/RPN11
MSKKHHQQRPDKPAASGAGASAPKDQAEAAGAESVKTGGWQEMSVKPCRREFPEPGRIDEPIRLALSAKAWTDMSAQARQSLDAEVCGVLVGELCEDEHGLWVSARAAIPGTSARQGGAHVTYTQETWQKIYEIKDRQYPKLQIVGWYHSHPGFGVEFSAMDLFIQENFFAGPTQFALVLDPLASEEAVCVNTPDGIQYVRHIWVEGRRRSLRAPEPRQSGRKETSGMVPVDAEYRLAQVEQRLQQALQAIEEDRIFRHRVFLTLGMLFASAVFVAITLMIYNQFYAIPPLPRAGQFVPVPIQVGDKTMLIGLNLIQWEVPPELNAALIELEKERLAKEAEKLEAAAPKSTEKKPASSAPTSKLPKIEDPSPAERKKAASDDSSSKK